MWGTSSLCKTKAICGACRGHQIPASLVQAPDMLQEAGTTSADPSWRKRPAHFASFGSRLDNIAVVTPDQSPRGSLNGPLMPHLNDHARTRFRYGIPDAQHLSFEGPGGHAVAEGELFMLQRRCAYHHVNLSGLIRDEGLHADCDEPFKDHLPALCRV